MWLPIHALIPMLLWLIFANKIDRWAIEQSLGDVFDVRLTVINSAWSLYNMETIAKLLTLNDGNPPATDLLHLQLAIMWLFIRFQSRQTAEKKIIIQPVSHRSRRSQVLYHITTSETSYKAVDKLNYWLGLAEACVSELSRHWICRLKFCSAPSYNVNKHYINYDL